MLVFLTVSLLLLLLLLLLETTNLSCRKQASRTGCKANKSNTRQYTWECSCLQ